MTTLSEAIAKVSNKTTTENGMEIKRSSESKLVDLFFAFGASRGQDELIVEKFAQAFNEDPEVAVRILLHGRDAREGMGERQLFRSVVKHLAVLDYKLAERVLPKIPELGRWDDVLCLIDTPVGKDALEMIEKALYAGDGLCAKWMPRKATKADNSAARIRKHMNLTPRAYRKLLVRLSETVEQQMSAKQFDQIEYSRVPSVAAARYQAAFDRNDPDRYAEYRDSLVKGDSDTKINAGAVFPYDVVRAAFTGDEAVANEQWKSLPDWIPNDKSFLSVVDVSGSMTAHQVSGAVDAREVAIGLGLYVAERCKAEAFRNKFITFSTKPEFVDVSGLALKPAIRRAERSNWAMTTNLEATLDLIVDSAVEHNVDPKDMPECLIIFSDMQFNQGVDSPNKPNAMIKQKFKNNGYKVPQIVYWNLANTERNTPVSFDKSGVALVSGFSPSLMKSVLSADQLNPMDIMLSAVMDDRYNF